MPVLHSVRAGSGSGVLAMGITQHMNTYSTTTSRHHHTNLLLLAISPATLSIPFPTHPTMSEFDYTYNWPPAYVDIFLVHGSPANSETSTDHDWSDVNSDTNSDIDSDTDSVGVSSDEYLDGERYGDYVKLRLRNGGRQRFASPPSREPSPCRGSSGSRSRSRSPERPGTVVEESIAERISRYRSREDVTREKRGRPRSKSWPGSVPSREFVHPNAMSTPEEPEKSEQQKHTPAEGELVGKEAKLCAKQQAESSSGDCAELEMEDMHQPIGPTAGKSSERETQDSAGPYAGISSPNFNWPKAYEATLRPENKFRTVHAGRRLTPRSSELLRNQNAIAFQQVSVRFNAGWRAPESWHIQLAYQYGTPVYFTMAIDSPAAALSPLPPIKKQLSASVNAFLRNGADYCRGRRAPGRGYAAWSADLWT
ncbi:hypothetical protein FN846DRAFT_990312 [Sphaerosporella brunnea]|uniref:Uncharacterized protein n=1 Tax=Sphaerosporella brunnea TaxID=1250544 RepID=A0A5J5EPR9_9PEZI|nr:hypothetical protein FN846DRAFT_990312 [Sphaerosporella brunnea]